MQPFRKRKIVGSIPIGGSEMLRCGSPRIDAGTIGDLICSCSRNDVVLTRTTPGQYLVNALMAELADARSLSLRILRCTGSTPVGGTTP